MEICPLGTALIHADRRTDWRTNGFDGLLALFVTMQTRPDTKLYRQDIMLIGIGLFKNYVLLCMRNEIHKQKILGTNGIKFFLKLCRVLKNTLFWQLLWNVTHVLYSGVSQFVSVLLWQVYWCSCHLRLLMLIQELSQIGLRPLLATFLPIHR